MGILRILYKTNVLENVHWNLGLQDMGRLYYR